MIIVIKCENSFVVFRTFIHLFRLTTSTNQFNKHTFLQHIFFVCFFVFLFLYLEFMRETNENCSANNNSMHFDKSCVDRRGNFIFLICHSFIHLQCLFFCTFLFLSLISIFKQEKSYHKSF